MNIKRILLAALTAITAVSFVDPVAARATMQSSVGFLGGLIETAVNWVVNNPDDAIRYAEFAYEFGSSIGLW